MAHGDAVADRATHIGVPDIEAEGLQFVAYNRADLIQMSMAGNLVGVRIDYGDKGLLKIVQRADDTFGHHQRGGRQHVCALGNNAAAPFTEVLDSRIHTFSVLDRGCWSQIRRKLRSSEQWNLASNLLREMCIAGA